VDGGGLFCCSAAVYHAAAKNQRGTPSKFVTHDTLTVALMRGRLDDVDADMLPVLLLLGPASANCDVFGRPHVHNSAGRLGVLVIDYHHTLRSRSPTTRPDPPVLGVTALGQDAEFLYFNVVLVGFCGQFRATVRLCRSLLTDTCFAHWSMYELTVMHILQSGAPRNYHVRSNATWSDVLYLPGWLLVGRRQVVISLRLSV